MKLRCNILRCGIYQMVRLYVKNVIKINTTVLDNGESVMDQFADKRYNDCPLREENGACTIGCEIELGVTICRSRCNRCCCGKDGCFINATCPRATGDKMRNVEKLVYMGWRNKKNETVPVL